MTGMARTTKRFSAGTLVVLAMIPCALWGAGPALTISVGPDEALIYPANLPSLPDEHTTIFPPAPGSNAYRFFASSSLTGGFSGAVVLETTDLKTFTFAPGYADQVITAPVRFTTCNPVFDAEFDENYAGPGSVAQDPTRPAGNLIMIYEAENHCPGGVWQQPFYATVGFARSGDNGKTWPRPVNGEFGGVDRYPILKLAASEPASEPSPAAMGNAIPSAIVDGNYLYVVYVSPQGPGAQSDGKIRVARALLGGNGQIGFLKWNNGTFSTPGIGGADTGVLPSGGCVGSQGMPSVSYLDTLGLFLMTFVCRSLPQAQGAWYFSTATSLDLQDWTVPQMIHNSQFPLENPCPGQTSDGMAFDGWYPSFMSIGSASGHLSQSGYVFLLNGCDTGKRSFMRRFFTISVSDNVQGMWWAAPANSESGWGINLSHQGTVIFATWFTYGADGKPTWFVGRADSTPAAPNTFTGDLYTGTGPAFTTVGAGTVVPTKVGTITLTFAGSDAGTFAYTVNGVKQSKEITRDVFGSPVPTCTFGAQPNLALATNYQDLWWNLDGSERWWGVNLAHQGDKIFLTWFTYAADGKPLWMVGTAQSAPATPNVYTGRLYRLISGPPFNGPFNAAPVTYDPAGVGDVTLTFADGNAATFHYTVDNVEQIKTITRDIFAPPGTVCQ